MKGRARKTSRYRGRDRAPAPSADQIIALLADAPGPQSVDAIARRLHARDARSRASLTRRLDAMAHAGRIIRNRRGAFGLTDKMELVAGRVTGHPDGFGFLTPDAGGADIYLSAREMQPLLHGDRALVRLTGHDERGRPRGSVVEVIERSNREVIGRFIEEGALALVVPDNRRINQDILIPKDAWGGARNGNIVVAGITRPPDRHHQPIGRVVEILGERLTPRLAIEIAIRAHELPHAWPGAVQDETRSVPHQVRGRALSGRLDLRTLPLVTIDGEDARDFDDAVYCERQGRGWRLLVAIADVSHYVKPGSALDAEASLRGNSVYFPDRVIPMLPAELSNGICSLNPGVDRLCIVCELAVDGGGAVINARFHDAVMRSAARLTYTEVAQILIDHDRGARERRRDLVPHLEELQRLYRQLRRRRERRGAIDLDSAESKIEFDAAGGIERITAVELNDAHRIIEECMIAANVAAAQLLIEHGVPGPFRVHAPPAGDRVDNLRTYLGELGLTLGGGDDPKPRDYARLLEAASERADRHLIQTILLRSLKLATYGADNVGHFGLAFDAYTHFTSPIRRYPDLLVHRAIRRIRRRGRGERGPGREALAQLAEHCSMTERRADEASRDVIAWLKCEYMADRVGEIFDGVVSTVTGFGLFVELTGVYVEGLIHVSALPGDYYHYDPVRHRLRGERSGRSYRLLDRLRVRVARVDLDERKIDFELLS